jgi:hypothetical protein
MMMMLSELRFTAMSIYICGLRFKKYAFSWHYYPKNPVDYQMLNCQLFCSNKSLPVSSMTWVHVTIVTQSHAFLDMFLTVFSKQPFSDHV